MRMRDTRGRDGKTGCYARMENKTLKIQIINLRCYTVVAGEPDDSEWTGITSSIRSISCPAQ